jgi:uncharacterized protein YbcI
MCHGPSLILHCAEPSGNSKRIVFVLAMIAHERLEDGRFGVGRPREHPERVAAGRASVTVEVTMKTQGEIEAAICEGITRFEQEYMGRGPKDIHAHLIDDLLVVRLRGVLTAAEQHLVKALPAEKGRDLLKQVRTHLLETARPILESMVREITGINVLSLHQDISTVTGEEVLVFTLAEQPPVRETKRK